MKCRIRMARSRPTYKFRPKTRPWRMTACRNRRSVHLRPPKKPNGGCHWQQPLPTAEYPTSNVLRQDLSTSLAPRQRVLPVASSRKERTLLFPTATETTTSRWNRPTSPAQADLRKTVNCRGGHCFPDVHMPCSAPPPLSCCRNTCNHPCRFCAPSSPVAHRLARRLYDRRLRPRNAIRPKSKGRKRISAGRPASGSIVRPRTRSETSSLAV